MKHLSDLRHAARQIVNARTKKFLFTSGAVRPIRRHPIKTPIVLAVARVGALISGVLGYGRGTLTEAKIARKLHPSILYDLTYGKRCVLITGSIGVTTTATMLAAAMRTIGDIAYSTYDENGEDEIIASLLRAPKAPFAFLGVTEDKVGQIAPKIQPSYILITNLTQDVEEGTKEYASKVHDGIELAIRLCPRATIIANCDNPLVVFAVKEARRIVWVNAGCTWKRQTVSVPYLDQPVVFKGETWYVPGINVERPAPAWTVDKHTLIKRENNNTWELPQQLTGRFYVSTAGFATIMATQFGVDVPRAIDDLSRMEPYVGRTVRFYAHGRHVTMTRTRTPQAIEQSLRMLNAKTSDIIIAFDSTAVTSDDVAWLWDTDIPNAKKRLRSLREQGKLHNIVASGQRAEELAVVLTYSGVENICEPSFDAALSACTSSGRVEVFANDRAFMNLEQKFDEEIARSTGFGMGTIRMERLRTQLQAVLPESVVKFIDVLSALKGGK